MIINYYLDVQDSIIEIDQKHAVLFTGDGGGFLGGKYMKWGFVVLMKDNPQGLSHLSLYAMSDAPDNYENMAIVHDVYTEDIKKLQNATSPLDKGIYCLLGGDFNFQYDSMALQGKFWPKN